MEDKTTGADIDIDVDSSNVIIGSMRAGIIGLSLIGGTVKVFLGKTQYRHCLEMVQSH